MSSAGSLFGSSKPSTATGIFGSAATASATPGQSKPGLFGSLATTPASPAQSKPGLFGSLATTAAAPAQTSTTGGLFGSNANNQTQQGGNTGGGMFGGAANQQSNQQSTGGGLFGANANAQPQQQQSQQATGGGLFGAPKTDQQTSNAGGLFGASKPDTPASSALSLFGGAKPAAPSSNAGSVFGAPQANPQSSSAASVFGASKPDTQTSSAASVFGAPKTNTQSANTGGLFGAPQTTPTASTAASLFGAAKTDTQPSTAASLFGAAKTDTQPSNAGSLFGQTQSKPSGGLLSGQPQPQQAQPTTQIPAVQINYDNLRPRTRFDDLAKPVQDEIALIDKGIQRVMKMKDEIGQFMPQHERDVEQLSKDVKFVETKFKTVQVALNRDIQTVKILQDLTKKSITDAQLSFKATDNLKLPAHYHQTGLFAGPTPAADSTKADSAMAHASAQDLITYFNRICDDVEKYKKRLDEYRSEIEKDMPGVENGLYEQIRTLRERKSAGTGLAVQNQLTQVLSAVRETGNAIIAQAGQIADTRERLSRLQAGILDSGIYAMGSGMVR
ncbi:hypothetical protein E4U57_004264 [Claviceps arundinis]|uniref:Nucleoporin NUP49/NSP49 n=1 Tax=Claviceps arundinis TaxID=1623583 RepID=A0A9P7SSI2_9HYPO|nr:hypothetical protein E4U57_004264 [Claviceps arundinis]KAG5971605.1 hypothetical protein E4U56_006708 [Claviceps arundinis]